MQLQPIFFPTWVDIFTLLVTVANMLLLLTLRVVEYIRYPTLVNKIFHVVFVSSPYHDELTEDGLLVASYPTVKSHVHLQDSLLVHLSVCTPVSNFSE